MATTLPKASTRASSRAAQLQSELRQRKAELAILEEVGQALGRHLDLDAIAELVGERLHQTFPDVGLFVALYDGATNMISFPYEIKASDGQRYHSDPFAAEAGLTAKVIKSRQPLLIRSAGEAENAGALTFGDKTESWLGVPLLVDEDVIGALALESGRPGEFDKDDLRVVSALGSTTAVALRSARLFDETKRLLAETEQRNAELAVVNEIGAALAKQLDFQGVIDAVGDKVGEVFGSRDLTIAILDEATSTVTFPYWYEFGVRNRDVPPMALGVGLTSRIISEGRPLRLGTAAEAEALGAVYVGDRSESYLGVPIRAGHRVIGALAVSRHEPNSYDEADEQLVMTIASSMGVALENARLFDETKRLLAETEQRNAELAVINEIGEALARQLDFQAIIDAVGDRIRSIFNVVTGADLAVRLGDEHAPHAVSASIRASARSIEEQPLGGIDGDRDQGAPGTSPGHQRRGRCAGRARLRS